MSERYWRWQAAAALLAGATAATVAGCGAGGNSASGSGAAAGGTSAGSLADAAGAGAAQGSGTAPANMTAVTGKAGISATRLRDALLTKIDGAGPAGSAEFGAYGGLPDVRASKESMRSVTVTPARCAQATATGFDSATFSAAPASVVTFRVGRDGVSEVLVAANAATAAKAMANHLPAGCGRYQATVAGRTFNYAVQQADVPGIAEQARALNVKASGYANVNVWSVVYRGNGFVGAVTIVGPDATEQAAKLLAKDAYARAAQSLQAKVH